jgi:hypothetical protein
MRPVLGIRIRSDTNLFAGSGAGSGSVNFDRIPDPDPTPLKLLIINQKRWFFLNNIFSKKLQNFWSKLLKQRHFEIFPKSGGFYSLRLDPGSGSGFFSEVGSGSGQNGPDPPKLHETTYVYFIVISLIIISSSYCKRMFCDMYVSW